MKSFDIDAANKRASETTNLIEDASTGQFKEFFVPASETTEASGTPPTPPIKKEFIYPLDTNLTSFPRIMTISEFVKSFDPKKMPVPNWKHLGVKSIATRKIAFDDIYIVSDTRASTGGNNTTRYERHTAAEIEALRLSFGRGVHSQEMPPAVVELSPEDKAKHHGKHYKLVYGYGRCEAIRLCMANEYFFTVLEGTPDAIEDVAAQENEGWPKVLNKEPDMIKFLQDKIKSGNIKNTESSIRDKFKLVYCGRGKDVETRVVNKVMRVALTPSNHYDYTSPVAIQEWVNYRSKVKYVFDGKFDSNLGRHGVICKEGYLAAGKQLVAAVKRYHKTGHKTNIFAYIDNPNNKYSYKEKRKAYLKEFDVLKAAFASCNMDIWPLELYGFLPQDIANEDLTEVIPASKYR